MALVAATRDLF